jgi:hypothetical protein
MKQGAFPETEDRTETDFLEKSEAKPYFLAGSWLLVAFCVFLAAKCITDIILDRTVLGPWPTIGGFLVLALPLVVLADMMGAKYVVSSR